MMDDILLLQTIERYLSGKMLPDEKSFFEQHRKNVPEIDQMVVEHSMFIHQMEDYAANHNLKHKLHDVHNTLLADHQINEGGEISTKGKVVKIWNKYRKVTAIAAVVGGAIALMISGLVAFFAPVNQQAIKELGQEVEKLKNVQTYQGKQINDVKSKTPVGAEVRGGGSGFLIDAKGYIVTNSHVLRNSKFANVYNNGKEYRTRIILQDNTRDLAILKIEDEDFVAAKSLPYSINNKNNIDLGEVIFTLGYPRNEMVFTQGFLSAKTGYNGDTLSCQIQMTANPGNSGGPVLNNNGEVIGILSTKEAQLEGVTFAITSKYIHRMVDQLKSSDTSYSKIKLPTYSSIKGMDRVSQVKKMEDCIFFIRAYN